MRRALPIFTRRYTHRTLKISPCQTCLEGSSGYRSAIATCAKSLMPLYFEAKLENNEGYARIGVATKDCELNGPIGIDDQGYSYGNKNGYGFHKSKRITMGDRFGENDILSVYLYGKADELKLQFFINGVKIDKDFPDVRPGIYWPAISLYGHCRVALNMGPWLAYELKIKAEMHSENIVKEDGMAYSQKKGKGIF